MNWKTVERQERAALRPEGEGAPLAALCLSGGGIRSATFALGVLQGLAEAGLLGRFDYLSTVSGGGYIGSWLTAWKQRAGGLERILPTLAPNARSELVEHLRAYNNYLSPRTGVLSADTWTLGATVIRNVVLNWLVFVPALLLLVLVPRMVLNLAAASPRMGWELAVAAAVLVAVGVASMVRDLPSLGGVNASRKDVLRFAVAPIAVAAVLGAGAARTWAAGVSLPVWVTVAPAVLLAAFLFAGSLGVGLTSGALHTLDREWLSRAGAELMLAGAGWLGWCGLVLLAPEWVAAGGHALAAAAAGVGGVSGWISAAAGFRSAATAVDSEGSTGWLQAAAALTLALVGVGLVWVDGVLLRLLPWHLALVNEAALGAGLFALAWFMARYININKFSLAGMYRDRLIRAFLGASGADRARNRFTGFAASDDLALGALDARLRPLPVLNMTLNLVGRQRLAWQQRKAESFTATPLACGCAQLGYRPAGAYGGRGGMTLGTAMAISGAAASPNMGYHSSPLVGFWMTLLNVRLGAWLGNPGEAGDKTWRCAGPSSAFAWLWREALGRTSNRSAYVYLSDGGHFENLGLYEMIRRRCQIVVVVDAGCDPDYRFEDLGNALRKIRIDFRVPITFAPGQDVEGMRARKQRGVVATIGYSALGEGMADGKLVYLKPLLVGNEAPDVASYAANHASFPHQTTLDQWFSEAQTESYRMLGLATAEATRPQITAVVAVGAAAGVE